jgi:hypothetical protein
MCPYEIRTKSAKFVSPALPNICNEQQLWRVKTSDAQLELRDWHLLTRDAQVTLVEKVTNWTLFPIRVIV